jgi:hypothetical protein
LGALVVERAEALQERTTWTVPTGLFAEHDRAVHQPDDPTQQLGQGEGGA